MKRGMRFILLPIIGFALAGALCADAKKEADKDPLAKFSDEDLVKIDFCFTKFCEAVAAKDAKLAAALIDELPKNLAKLDLNKEADRATFLKSFAGFVGASIVASQRMPAGGLGEVTYTDKSGAEKKQRMQNVGGRWKITGL
jgi:hypothetical protein